MAALARYQVEQGLLKQVPPVESLFVGDVSAR
jgi:hypothetical protein